MKLLVKNGVVLGPWGQQSVDLLCSDGRIGAILERGSSTAADEVVDAVGKLVFPGFIDPHVHSRDPGLTHKEDFAHSTMGALAGGVTTLLEMPNAVPPVTDVESFRSRRMQHEAVAWVDFGLWGLSMGRSNIDQVAGLFGEGAVALKVFWGYALREDTKELVYNIGSSGSGDIIPPPDNGAILEVCAEVARNGGLVAAHCEDPYILRAAQASLGKEINSYDDLLTVRPEIGEAAAITLAVEFAHTTGCRFHVVHLASARGAELIRRAQGEGIAISAETCPQYLTFTDESFRNGVAPVKVYPPIRTQHDQDALWVGVQEGTISSIGSDHAPHTIDEKNKSLAEQPAGIVGVQTLVPLMLDGMSRGKVSPERLSEILSTSTARLYGLHTRKGRIGIGADADLTIVDPEARHTIRDEDLRAKNPQSPWAGATLTGRPCTSVLRGQVVMHEGEPVGPRRGRFVAASWS